MRKKTESSIPDNFVLAKIKHYCEIRGLSIYKLAKYSDIPYSSLNNIFVRNTEPTVPTLQKICNGLGISMSEFFDDTPPKAEATARYDWISKDEQWLVETYRKLPADDRKILKAYMRGLARL